MGGACAQEVIKVVTEQFVPINNTFIYNAMKQTSISLELWTNAGSRKNQLPRTSKTLSMAYITQNHGSHP